MRKRRRGAVLAVAAAGALLMAAAPVRAGWKIEQENYSRRPNGEYIAKRVTTLLVSKGRVRVVDDSMTIIIDYAKDRLTLMLPAKSLYWTGSSDDYLSALAAASPEQRADPKAATTPSKAAKIDIEVKNTGEADVIAGHRSTKYEVKINGKNHQFIWIADDLHLGSDLDPQRLQQFQEKIGHSLRGESGQKKVALSRDPAYLELYRKGFPMRTNSFLGTSVIGREVSNISPATVEDGEFDVPKTYISTSLPKLLEAEDDLSR